MRAAQSPADPAQILSTPEPELILPPIRALGVLVTALTAFVLAAIIAAHLVAGARSGATGQPAGQAPARPTAASGAGLRPAYPYSDPATIGLY